MNTTRLLPLLLCIAGLFSPTGCSESVENDTPSETQSQPLSSRIRYPGAGEGIKIGDATQIENQAAVWALEDSLNVGQSINSGSKKFVVRQLSPQEVSSDEANKEPLQPPATLNKIGEALASEIAQGAFLRHRVTVWLDLDLPNINDTVEEAIIDGRIQTSEDKSDIRKQVLESRSQLILAAQNAVIASAPSDSSITYKYKNIPALELDVSPQAVSALAQMKSVVRIDRLTSSKDSTITGTEVVEGSQITQFIDDGFDGFNSSPFFYTQWAVIELDGANYNHVAFRSTSSPSSSRILGTLDCSGSGGSATCASGSWATYGSHATAVTAIVAGDLRDGQDASVTNTADRIARSGYSGESRGLVYRANYGTTQYDRVMAAYDDLIAKDNVHISNQSNGTPYNAGNADDPTCTGTTNFGRTINEVYEAGILPVIAAGNSGQVGSTCTLSSPSAALGAFTVAGHGSNRNTDTETAVRSGSLSSTSSQGPASLRTMVDLSAYEGRTLLPDVSGGYAYNNVGTSFAAPTVVAAALNFIHFYKSTFSDFIENPGALAANMLLMGDRQGASGLQTQRFSNQWGAGRMKMRLWNTEGIDNPAIYATGSVCVGHNQVVTIPLNSGNAFSSDIDYIKAVAYWHDTRHDMSAKAPVDTITMIATMLPALWA